MPFVTLRAADHWPDGTTVRAYLARNHPPGLTAATRGVAVPPSEASAVDTQVVANGQVSFDRAKLEERQLYWAAATVGGKYRQLAFVAPRSWE